MVEIWRWPKLSYSVSEIACMDTPSRIAASRSTRMKLRRPAFCWSEATLANCGRVRSFASSFGAHSASSAGSVSTSVYWNWVRLIRVPIWISCTGWKNAEMPGMPAIAWASRAVTTATGSRSWIGFRAMVSRPALAVALMAPAPISEVTPVTAGSAAMMSATWVCNAAKRGMEMLWDASVTATMTPVSWRGRKPLGTITYSQTVPPRVASASSSIARWWRSEVASVRRYRSSTLENPRSAARAMAPWRSCPAGRSSLAHIIGVRVSDTTAETMTATDRVTANSLNSRPTTPVMNSIGMNTATSETVSETMVKPIWRAPL